MPFEKLDVKEYINNSLEANAELKEAWDSSRTEYKVLGELVKLRKEKQLSQAELADLSGNKQQAISRLESKGSSPTLKTLCSILDVLGYDITLTPKSVQQR